VSDIDTVAVDSLKALDPKRPIREADIGRSFRHVRFGPTAEVAPQSRYLVSRLTIFSGMISALKRRTCRSVGSTVTRTQ
jgi:hypothetical protein